MKILVTGGCGFIGSHIVDAYIQAGHKVVVADKKDSNLFPYKNPKALYYQLDLAHSKRVNSLIELQKPDIINHHAANISLAKSIEKPLFDAKNNISAIINLLEATKKYNIPKIIFASSAGALYSGNTALPFTEKTPTSPLSPYGVSKLASEHYIKTYAKLYGLKYVILRYSNVYGPRQSSDLKPVISVFIDNLLKNKQPIINNDGTQTRDFLFVEDLKSANILALDYDKNACLNVSSGKETSIVDIFKIVKTITKSTLDAEFKHKKIIEQYRSVISYEKIKQALNWQPQHSLEKGIKETIKWYENI